MTKLKNIGKGGLPRDPGHVHHSCKDDADHPHPAAHSCSYKDYLCGCGKVGEHGYLYHNDGIYGCAGRGCCSRFKDPILYSAAERRRLGWGLRRAHLFITLQRKKIVLKWTYSEFRRKRAKQNTRMRSQTA